MGILQLMSRQVGASDISWGTGSFSWVDENNVVHTAADVNASYIPMTSGISIENLLAPFAANVWDYDVRKYGAVGDGTIDDTAAFTAALAAAPAGSMLYLSPGSYKISGLTINKSINIISDGRAEVLTDAALTTLFTVTSSGVRFCRLKLTGTDTTLTDVYGQKSAIHVPGVKTTIYNNIVVEDCEISGFQIGVCAPFTSFRATGNYIHNVGAGIVGGHDTWTPAEQNLTSVLYVEIASNDIACEFGTQTLSRPISLPLYTGGGSIHHNKLRGGGMAIEATLDTATANLAPYCVTDNDCDTSISATNGGVISGNVIDLSKAPVGRGQHPAFFQAIEAGYNSTVIGNVVRNHTNGFGQVMPYQRIIGNTFEGCGDQGGAAGAGNGFVIGYGADAIFAADTVFNTVISGNTIKGTKGLVADISLNWTGTWSLTDLTVADNKHYDCNYYGALIGPVQAKFQGNTMRNVIKSDNTAFAIGMWHSGTGVVEFLDNTFVNTVAGGFGMYQAIAPQAADTVGYQKCTGLRLPGTPIEATNAYKQSASVLSDGVYYNPRNASVTLAAGAVSTVVSNQWVNTDSKILLTPTSATAAADVGSATGVYVSAIADGVSFTITHPNTADIDKTFYYQIVD